MKQKHILSTYHSVEFVRKGHRVVERGDFRLDVPFDMPSVDRSMLVEAFVCEADPRLMRQDKIQQTRLYGYDGGLWRPAFMPQRFSIEVTADAKGCLVVGSKIHPALKTPLNTHAEPTAATPFEPFDHPGCRIVSDDREERMRVARDAARKLMLVEGDIWVKVRNPQWKVVKAEMSGPGDLRLVFDVHNEYGNDGHMRFRLDRFEEALAWARVVRGSKSVSAAGLGRMTSAQRLAAISQAPWRVTRLDTRFFTEDDVVEFARHHLESLITLGSLYLDVMPDKLRRRWEELRDLASEIDGDNAGTAARAALSLVGGTLDMLREIRDVGTVSRSTLLRSVTRLQQNQRRAEMIEGVVPLDAVPGVSDDDIGALAP